MRIGKTICNIIAGLTLTATTSMGFELPDKFKDYRTKATYVQAQIVATQTGSVIRVLYDLDGDMKPDVSELYGMQPNQQPKAYGFDLDNNHYISPLEVWVDEARDGWNGNEVRLDKFLKLKHGI